MTQEPEGVADVEASLVEASSCKIIARIDWADMLDPLCRGREGPCLLNAKMWQMCAHVLVQEDLPKFPNMRASPAATHEKAQELHPQFSQNTISVKGCLILSNHPSSQEPQQTSKEAASQLHRRVFQVVVL